MTKPKKRAATVHFDPDLWDRVEQLAQEERRPVSQLLRNLISDAVDVHSGRAGGVAA
jgi:predicted transcriptional regulator